MAQNAILVGALVAGGVYVYMSYGGSKPHAPLLPVLPYDRTMLGVLPYQPDPTQLPPATLGVLPYIPPKLGVLPQGKGTSKREF